MCNTLHAVTRCTHGPKVATDICVNTTSFSVRQCTLSAVRTVAATRCDVGSLTVCVVRTVAHGRTACDTIVKLPLELLPLLSALAHGRTVAAKLWQSTLMCALRPDLVMMIFYLFLQKQQIAYCYIPVWVHLYGVGHLHRAVDGRTPVLRATLLRDDLP